MTQKEVQAYLANGIVVYKGILDRILIQGPDTFDFLNRLSTQKFTNNLVNTSIAGAFLTDKSEIISLFQAWVKSTDEVELFLENENIQTLMDYIHERHFSENFKIVPQNELVWIEMRGQKIPYQNSTTITIEEIGEKKIIIIPLDHWGIPGVLMGSTDPENILGAVKSSQFKILDDDDLKLFQAYYGFKRTYDNTTQILEAGLDRYINRDKGCYPGQEVVEKIYTYGKPAKKLVQFVFEAPASKADINKLLESNQRELVNENKTIGKWTEIYYLEELCFGLGVVERLHSGESNIFSLGAGGPKVKIKKLT